MIGIHYRPGSFSDRWISYCIENMIPYRLVNCFSSDILFQVDDLEGLLWHWSHAEPADLLVARQIIAALEMKGIEIFPSICTCWHFDDKIAQKYLLESINAPLIPTWVFTKKSEALKWIQKCSWPKVFKLRCGAGSSNVNLVRSRRQADILCHQAFGKGFPAITGYMADIKTKLRKTNSFHKFISKIKHAPQSILNVMALRRQISRERGYVYFQEFLPNNTFDTRITIIGDRAFGFIRNNRPNDFRASGSGAIEYSPTKINRKCVEIAFSVTKRIRATSLAFDFLYNAQNEPMIGEISYCYKASAVEACSGFWDSNYEWHDGHVSPEVAILNDLLVRCKKLRKDTIKVNRIKRIS